MKNYVPPKWRQVLAQQSLIDFESLWHIQADPLDKPNTGRGRTGWSVATLLTLPLVDGKKKRLILKRQQNYFSRSLRHPFRGIPTFEKEFSNLLRYKRLGISVPEPVYYAKRQITEGIQVILITEYLEEHTPLDKLERFWQKQGRPGHAERNKLIDALAYLTRMLHQHGMAHNCLYPKHCFIQQLDDKIQVRLIDLEKSRWSPLGNRRRIRDLEALYRRSKGCTHTDRLRFLKTYHGLERLDKKARHLCRQILERNKKKSC